MKIRIGSNRIVFVFPKAGVAIKLPKIHLTRCFEHFCSMWMRNKKIDFTLFKKRINAEIFRYNVQHLGTIKHFLFYGIYINREERSFYRKTKHAFTVPTYISLFGFLNIQKFANVIELSYQEWTKVTRYMLPAHEDTKGLIWQDGHHFSNPQNFAITGGKLQLLDYGSPRTQEIIMEKGSAIQQDPKIIELYLSR